MADSWYTFHIDGGAKLPNIYVLPNEMERVHAGEDFEMDVDSEGAPAQEEKRKEPAADDRPERVRLAEKRGDVRSHPVGGFRCPGPHQPVVKYKAKNQK